MNVYVCVRITTIVCVRAAEVQKYVLEVGWWDDPKWQLGTIGGFCNRGCRREPIANICWLAGSGEMDCSGTASEKQFHHHLDGPVHLVFLEHWGDLLVKG